MESEPMVWRFDRSGTCTQVHTVDVWDRGALYGVSVFETMRFRGGEVAYWSAHMERFERGLRVLFGSQAGWLGRDGLARQAAEVLRRAGVEEGVVRVCVSEGGVKGSGVSGRLCTGEVGVLWSVQARQGLGVGVYERGWSAGFARRWKRPSVGTMPLDVKWSGAYGSSVLATREVEERGAKVALMCDVEGYVVCGAWCNVFWRSRGVVYTPDVRLGALPGVVRGWLMREVGGVVECRVRPEDVLNAQEVWVSASTVGVVALTEVDGRKMSGGVEGEFVRMVRGLWGQSDYMCWEKI